MKKIKLENATAVNSALVSRPELPRRAHSSPKTFSKTRHLFYQCFFPKLIPYASPAHLPRLKQTANVFSNHELFIPKMFFQMSGIIFSILQNQLIPLIPCPIPIPIFKRPPASVTMSDWLPTETAGYLRLVMIPFGQEMIIPLMFYILILYFGIHFRYPGTIGER